MPVRFTAPSLGGQRQSFLGTGEWQIGVAYRHLGADKWFVGTEVNEPAAPFGNPLYLSINSLDFSLAYGVSDRLGLTLTLPFLHGTQSRFYADLARHKVGGSASATSVWLEAPGSSISRLTRTGMSRWASGSRRPPATTR